MLGLIATFAWVEYANSLKLDDVVASNEVPELFTSSLSGIEFTEYESPKKLVSYYAVLYGLDKEHLERTIVCESNFRHEGLFGDSGKAYGIGQFWESTFNKYCPDLQYKDMHDQLWCMSRMFSNNLQYNWTCAK